MKAWLTALLPALLVLGVVVSTAPLSSPDGVEMAMAGRCLLRLPVDGGACAGLEPWMWPPAFPLLSGALALFLRPDLAALLVGLAAGGALVVPLCSLARRLGGEAAGLAVVPLLLAVPSLRTHMLTGEARTLALLGLFGAWALLVPAELGIRRRLTGGLLAGLALLSRPEAILGVGLLLAWLLWRDRSRAWPVLAGALGVWLPYVALISVIAGHLALTSRGWQAGAYGWLEVLPEDWVTMDLAAGSRGTPLRAMLATASVPYPSPPTAGAAQALAWLGFTLRESLPLWLIPLAGLGGWVAWRRRMGEALWVMVLLALPCLPISLLPQAHDDALPANNVLSVLLVGVLLAAAATGWLARGRAWALAGLSATWIALGILIPTGETQAVVDPATFALGTAWIEAESGPQARVGATLVTAPLVHAAGRPRAAIPGPWAVPSWLEGPDRPDLLVISDIDLPFAAASLHAIEASGQAELLTVLTQPGEWLAIYRLRPRGAG